MIEKQNAVERKEAAGDADDIDDVIDAGTRKMASRAVSGAGAGHSLDAASGVPR